jgi:hypothetical protein
VGFVQVPVAHAEVAPVSDEALVERLLAPLVNVVEVIVRFQPAPVPRVSCTVIGTV